MIRLKLFSTFCFVAVFVLSNNFLFGQSASSIEDAFFNIEEEVKPDVKQSLFNHLQQEELVTLALTTNIDQLLAQKNTNRYQPAEFAWTTADGSTKTMGIKVRARGKTRRKLCSFPPLKLKFDKTDLSAEGFAPFKSLKLVTHCMEDEAGQSNILKEYLAYKLFNELTDQSFRVQLLKVNYTDSETGEIYGEKYAFLIESTKELGQRLNAKELNHFSLDLTDLEPKHAQKMAVFQYLIGNTDWQVAFLHNMKLFQVEGVTQPIAIPYDFDYAGLVNADYAKPNPDFKQKNVRQRIYMNQSNEYLTETLDLLAAKRSNILATIESFDLLDAAAKNDLVLFVNDFYNVVDNKKKRKKAFKPIAKNPKLGK